MRKTGLFIAAVLFLIFFVWAFSGSFDELFLFCLPWVALMTLALSVFFSFSSVDTKVFEIIDFLEKHAFTVFPALAFVFSLCFSIFVFSALPHAPDEINYKYLAEAILDGRITTPLHPHYEFFHVLYTNPTISGTYSIYQIGYSVFLAPFVFFKVPFLCNPLLNAVSVFLTGKIAEEFYGGKAAFLSMMFAACSLFIILLGGTLMAHSFCAACTLSSFYFAVMAVKSERKKRVVFSLLSGLFISFLMFIRPQNALFVLFFVVLYLFVFTDKKSFFKITLIMGCLIFAFLLLFVYSNYAISGKITEFKHVKYWNISEPVDDCMGLGLGKGCKFGTYYEMPENGLTIPLAAKITAERLLYFVLIFLFNPLMLLFLVIRFIFAADRDSFKKDLIMLAGFLIPFTAYFFYYYLDNGYGARYYFECSFFLFPLIAEGVLISYRKSKTFFVKPLFKRGIIVSAFILASFAFQNIFSLPHLISFYSSGSWSADRLLDQALKEKNIGEGVFFIAPDFFYANGASLMNLHKIDENKQIFALDLGFKSNQSLMNYYKNKKFYSVAFNINENTLPVINEITREPNITEITAEAEHKSYPVDGTPDYCNKFPQYPDFVNKYSGFSLPQELVSGRVFFFCKFTESTQFYTFGQHFEKSGNYKVRITFAATPESGKFDFESGKFSRKLDFYSANPRLGSLEFEAFFEKGMNFIKLTPGFEGKSQYFIIDKFEFFPPDKV
ncbi:hypothetical protein J5690_07240 [bacterium]|nr:hypothetical protein [bacterium]